MASARMFITDSDSVISDVNDLIPFLHAKGLLLRHDPLRTNFRVVKHSERLRCTTVSFSNKRTRKRALAFSFSTKSTGAGFDFEDNFHNLTTLSEGTAFDIVILHGFNEHAYDSWAYHGANGDSFMWLRDYLPEHIPGARIMLFGYNTDCFSDVSEAQIRMGYAETFVYRLICHREITQSTNRPLVFLAHGMGGLILKQALLIGEFNGLIRDSILNHTRGVMFFGTPHIPFSDLKTAKSNSHSSVRVKVLNPNRIGLNGLTESFKRLAEEKRIRVVSAYEGKKTRVGLFKSILIVDKKSASSGIPGERLQLIDADHENICKFQSPDDPSLRKTTELIKMLCEEVPPPYRSRSHQRGVTPSTQGP